MNPIGHPERIVRSNDDSPAPMGLGAQRTMSGLRSEDPTYGRGNPRGVPSSGGRVVYETVGQAASTLSTTPAALWARCRRNARREGRDVVARIGGGVVAVKLGRSWRVCFPQK